VDTKLAEESLPEDQRYKYNGDEGVDGGGESEGSIPVAGDVSEGEVEALADEIDEASTGPVAKVAPGLMMRSS
jgi:hypothetical protein